MKRPLLSLVSGIWLLVSPAFAIIDENNNGLSDLWEKAHNNDQLFPNTFDPQADDDQDGWTNAEEAAAGTDPADPNPPDGLVRPDTAHIPATYHDPDEDGIPDILTPETITLTWPTIPGKQYTLLVSTDLAPESWLPCGQEATFIGNGNQVTYGFPTSISVKSFWRIAVTDTDSDEDGLSNTEEHALGSNPESADSDGDHLADGDEVTMGTDPTNSQSDPDGIPDDLDADPTDGRINWEKSLPYRYALFPLELQGTNVPKQVNNLGDVLYGGNLLYRAAEFISLPQTAGTPNTPKSLNTCEAAVMEDGGRIYGRGNVRLDPSGSGSCWVTWPAGGGTPSALEDAGTYASYNEIQQELPGDMHFTTQADGSKRFIATANVPYAVGNSMEFRGLNHPGNSSYAWTLSGGDGTIPLTVTRDENPADIRDFAISPLGEIMTTLNEGGLPVAVGGVSLGTYSLKRITKLPSGREIALGRYAAPLVSNNGQWEEVPGFKGNCVEASANTGFVFREDGKVWQNGQVWEGKDVFPELVKSATDRTFPEPLSYWDASPAGFLLASHSITGSYPIRFHLGVPVDVKQGFPAMEQPFQGVDAVSLTARKGDTEAEPDPNGWVPRVWIMAPAGTDAANDDEGTWAEIHVPEMGNGTTLHIVPENTRIQTTPADIVPGDYTDIRLTAAAGGSEDSGLKLELSKDTGTQNPPPSKIQSASIPIGVKIMKKRTVKVTLHPMTLRQSETQNPPPDDPPDHFPAATEAEKAATKAKLETRLNDIYGKQVNTFFNVTVLDAVPADYDQPGTNLKGVGFFGHANTGSEISNATPDRRSPTAQANIDIWALGGVVITETGQGPANGGVTDWDEIIGFRMGTGPTDSRDPRIIVNGDFGLLPKGHRNLPEGGLMEPDDALDYVLTSVAHEIGHVMIGVGHPDAKAALHLFTGGLDAITGPAPLKGTDPIQRLMYSSMNRGQKNTLLVKREWDEIEKWLKHEEDEHRLP